MPVRTFDWEVIKTAYVTGDMDLNVLSREYNELPTSPSYQALRNKASQEKWHDQRKAYRVMLGTKVTEPPRNVTAQEIMRNTEALIDSAEAISRHIRLAKTLQGDVLELNKHVLPAIKNLDLSKAKPLEVAALIRAMADVLTKATDIERKAMGLVDPAQNYKIDIESTVQIDYSKLSEEELTDLYQRKLKTVQ